MRDFKGEIVACINGFLGLYVRKRDFSISMSGLSIILMFYLDISLGNCTPVSKSTPIFLIIFPGTSFKRITLPFSLRQPYLKILIMTLENSISLIQAQSNTFPHSSFPFQSLSSSLSFHDYNKICHHLTKQFLFMRSYIYPTNNFGNHNNTHFYFYSRSVTQGNNWSSYGLHQLEIVNDSDSNIEVVGWSFKEGRVEEDFKTNVVRPGLFYTARLVPNSWGTYKSIIGALTVKVQGTSQFYTIAFEDPFHDYVNKGYKGHIEEGNNPDRAISNLKDHNPKTQPWGRYEFAEFDGRGKTVFTITNKGR